MIIDSPTLKLWRELGVSKVFVRFVSGGCAGTKVQVEVSPKTVEGSDFSDIEGIAVHFSPSDREKLADARLTRVEKDEKETWILTSPNVVKRCGCGSSFALGDEDVAKWTLDLSKIATLKKALAKNYSKHSG